MKLKTLIIDDESNSIRSLSILLEKHCPDIYLAGSADNVEEAVKLIEEQQPDLVFLDIEMPSGSGFNVVEKTRHVDYKFVFTTAYDEYAIQAFKANAVDYILKPIDALDLVKTVSKVSTIILKDKAFSDMSRFMQSRETPKLPVPTGEGYKLLDLDMIIHIESDSNYSRFNLKDGTRMIASKTLKEFESQLDENQFLRVHNSYLVNRKHITKCVKSDGGHLVMSDGTIIPVSSRKKQAIFALLT